MQCTSDVTDATAHIKCPAPSINHGGSLDATSTPPRNRESRKSKRTRYDSSDDSAEEKTQNSSGYDMILRPSLQRFAKQLLHWLQSLGANHPSCKAIPHEAVIRLSLAVTMRFVDAIQPTTEDYKVITVLTASFWIAIKFIAARHTLPNASFIGHVTGVVKGELVPMELTILEALDWDVYDVARECGVLPDPE